MRNTTRLLVGAGALAAGSLIIAAPAMAATQFTSPAGSTYTATSYTSANANGQPNPWTVQASGFTAGQQVFAEFCDGVAPTTPNYDPAQHCDIGSSPAAAVADSSGVVTFASTDGNHHILPFLGDSQQSLFACIYPGQPVGANGYTGTSGTAYTNCQLRLSTNNTSVTSDQVYQTVNYVNPAGAQSPASTTYGGIGAVGGAAVVLGGGLFFARRRRVARAV